jgi:hypothetical protein
MSMFSSSKSKKDVKGNESTRQDEVTEKEKLVEFVQDIDDIYKDAAKEFVFDIMKSAAGGVVKSIANLVPGGDVVFKLCTGIYCEYQGLGKSKSKLLKLWTWCVL